MHYVSFVLPRRSRFLLFVLWVLAAGVASGQSLIMTEEEGTYSFKTTHLFKGDLVFYRFSDGFHLMAPCLEDGDGAVVEREFLPANNHAVTAYIARKGGPILLITHPPFSVEGAHSAHLPYVGLENGEYIRLAYTWAPFINTSGLMPLHDPTTTPEILEAAEPWFLLPVTLSAPLDADHAEISIPAGLVSAGTIYKSHWVQEEAFYPDEDGPVLNIYNTPSKVTIAFSPMHKGEFNVYIVVKGTPKDGELFRLEGKIFETSTLNVIGESSIEVEGRQNPHDPNILTAYDPIICPHQINGDPLHYRIEFQNTGWAPVEDVSIRVNFKTQYTPEPISLVTSNVSNVTLSHPQIVPYVGYGSVDPTLDFVLFNLPNVNIPGLYQSPPPTKASQTIGWVEFDIQPKDCLPPSGILITQAIVTFTTETFSESVNTNITRQLIDPQGCPPQDRNCAIIGGPSGGERSNVLDATPMAASPNCYPSPFNDHLNMEVPMTDQNTRLTVLVSDLTGKKWIENSYLATAGEAFRQVLETGDLPGGMYLVQFIQGGQTSTCKILKI